MRNRTNFVTLFKGAKRGTIRFVNMCRLNIYTIRFGADLGFDEIHETQGACPGAVGLVKSRKTIIANDETFALAA